MQTDTPGENLRGKGQLYVLTQVAHDKGGMEGQLTKKWS